jgi:hypothetical protein
MPKEKLYSAEQGAHMTRLTLSSFRSKASRLMIKGQKQGRQVFYTRRQLEDVYQSIPSKLVKAFKEKKGARTKSIKQRAAEKRKRVSDRLNE